MGARTALSRFGIVPMLIGGTTFRLGTARRLRMGAIVIQQLTFAFSVLLAASAFATKAAGAYACQDRYVDVRALHMFYRQCGDGPPLVLFHGAAQVVEGWAPQINAFAGAGYSVFVPERRGIGRTADIAGEWTYREMAKDMEAFMDALSIRRAGVVGLSDGGIIALLVATERPDLVARLVVSGANYNPESLGPLRDEFARSSPEEIMSGAPPQVQPWLDIQRHVSPDRGAELLGEFAKMKQMWLNFEITDAELARISAPTLVMAGDQDIIPVPYTVSLWQKIPRAYLCIAPDASHFWVSEKPQLANRILLSFLKPLLADQSAPAVRE